MKKKIIIITSIVAGSIILLISIALILLSVLFPNELVRKEIEKQATEYLGVNVKLEKLKFSIFRGFVLNGLSISQKGYGWAYPEILKLDSIILEYRLFPLLAREISVKGFVIEKGELHLERKKGIDNYDYFNKKFSIKDNKKIEVKKETKTDEKKQLSRSEFPINVDVKKCGFEGLLVTYNDDSFFDIPIFADLSQIKFIGRNISLKNNKPFDLESRINIKLNAGKYLEFNAVAKADGNIKIFSGDSFNVNPTGPIKIKTNQAGFKSNNINDLIIFFIKEGESLNDFSTVFILFSNSSQFL
jgi:uncharacterized protein involved in outer membrane biogenesis